MTQTTTEWFADMEVWFSSVGSDGRAYPWEQHAFFFSGCLVWVLAYLLMLRRARSNQFFEMAAVAGASNFGWEVVWGLRHETDMGLALVWCYRAWFIVDLALFAALLAWGHKQVSLPWLKRHFRLLLIGGTVAFAAGYEFLVRQGLDTTIGATSAYLCQFVLSLSCLLLALQMPSTQYLYRDSGILRSLGTGSVTVFMFLHYPDKPLILLFATCSALLDLAYLAVLQLRHASTEEASHVAESRMTT